MKTLTSANIVVVMTMPSGEKIELKPFADSIKVSKTPLEFSTKHLANMKSHYEKMNKGLARLDALAGVVIPKWEGEE